MKKVVNRNPRVAVTFTPEAFDLLEELSQLLEQPKSSLVSELVTQALPALRNTVEAVRIAREQPREAQRLMADYAAKATQQLAEEQAALDQTIAGRETKNGAP